jgi:hypothetical protein
MALAISMHGNHQKRSQLPDELWSLLASKTIETKTTYGSFVFLLPFRYVVVTSRTRMLPSSFFESRRSDNHMSYYFLVSVVGALSLNEERTLYFRTCAPCRRSTQPGNPTKLTCMQLIASKMPSGQRNVHGMRIRYLCTGDGAVDCRGL